MSELLKMKKETRIGLSKRNVKTRMNTLFKVTLDQIKAYKECVHDWGEKDGTAYYRCTKCNYLADDKELDKLISIQRLIDKGLYDGQLTNEQIKDILRYV